MGGASKFLKWVLGVFGSLFMLFGFSLFFYGLVMGNMVAVFDDFDDITRQSVKNFIDDNREETREFMQEEIIKRMGPMEDIVTRDTMEFLCKNPEAIFVEGGGAIDFQSILGEEVCGDLDTKTDEEIRISVFDALIDQSIDLVLTLVQQTEEVEAALEESKGYYLSYRPYLFGSAIFIYLLGVFLTFWASSFNWKKGLYTVALQTAIKLFTVALVFIYMGTLKPESILKLLEWLKPHLPELASVSVPPFIMKLGAAVMLDILQTATSPLILLSLLISIPFAITVIVLLIVRKKERKNQDSKTLKDEVV